MSVTITTVNCEGFEGIYINGNLLVEGMYDYGCMHGSGILQRFIEQVLGIKVTEEYISMGESYEKDTYPEVLDKLKEDYAQDIEKVSNRYSQNSENDMNSMIDCMKESLEQRFGSGTKI